MTIRPAIEKNIVTKMINTLIFTDIIPNQLLPILGLKER